MARSRKTVIAATLPVRRGLSETEAAVYVSLSPSNFRDLVGKGVMPRPRVVGSRRIWDVEELDAAFKALPREGGDDSIYDLKSDNTWSDFES